MPIIISLIQLQKMINKIVTQGHRILMQCYPFAFARVKFPLPDLGEKIKQGTVKKLYVNEGDHVQEFQKIADVQSDKQFTQITAPQTGQIAKIHYKQKQVCKVGDLFMEIQAKSEHSTQSESEKKSQINRQKNKQKVEENKEKDKQQHKPKQQVDRFIASAVVRMYAHSHNIDLSKVLGSGKKGRILKQDITEFLSKKIVKQEPNKQASLSSKQKLGTATEQKLEHKLYQTKTVSMNLFQKGMQKSMTQANKVPHLYLHQTMDVTQLDSMRQKLKQSNLKVTVMGILIKTFSLALKDNPRMNSTYRTDKDLYSFQIHDNHNISLAIDTPNGLVVPNIKNVQDLSILDIQNKLNELKKLSNQAKLTKDHLQKGTVCLSNIGTIAGIYACPLVLCPQICIVAIGKVVQSPQFVGNQYVKRKNMTISFGCDHRVIDGASVARLSNSWKSILQNPYLAMAKMK